MRIGRARKMAQGLIALGLWASVAAPVQGGVIFSNLGPGDTWDHGSTYVINGATAAGSPRPYVPAMHFTPTVSAQLSAIELPLGIISGTNRLVVELLADTGGVKDVPGALIESFTFTSLPGSSSMSEPLSVGTSVLKPVLQANTTYWLAAFPGASDSSGGWNLTSPLQTGTFASSEDGGSTWVIDRFGRTEISAFEVDGVALPEPTTLALCALGGILLAGYGARRRIGLPGHFRQVIEREPPQA